LKKLENLLTKHLNNHTLNKALGKCNLFSTAMAKRLKPVELFLAVGLAATVGACGGPATEGGEGAEGDTTPPTEVAPEGGEAGEGGEAVKAVKAAKVVKAVKLEPLAILIPTT
jgi:hypothetical protein